jgi:monofunctional biosynthetic peptidoglycan transglycosylase
MARRPFMRAVPLIVAALVAIPLLWLGWIAAHVAWYRYHPPRETAFMVERLDEARARGRKLVIRYSWVPYDRIAPAMKRAIIAAEDAKFAEHFGFDWEGIALAQEKNRRRGRIVAGGSTITQQLAKNLFLSPTKSYWRKGEEAVITLLLEAMLSKERILELYLNVIEWGNGVFGVEAAARRYFGVDARRLTPEQAARLAAMAPAPRLFERNPESAYLAGRVATIMARMSSAQLP